MNESQKLLAEYVNNTSESAFRELVARYINLVYSTAFRLANGDAHLAEDISQTVFVDLARKAKTLPRDVMLGGWLHRDTCFVAGRTMRGERRRHFRERQVAAMNIPEDHTQANLELLAPILDEAINQLDAEDRDAILLRFFEQLEYRAVGKALGSTEDAARMRVTRALDKLHDLLKNRGVTLSAAALGAGLAAGAITAAPLGLGATIAGTALATVASTGAAATLLKFMTLTKLKIAMVSAIAITAVAVPVVLQHQSLAKLREENQSLQQQTADLQALQTESQRLSNLVDQATVRPPISQEQARELARLRNAVGTLRDQTNKMGSELAQLRMTRESQRGEALEASVEEVSKRSFHATTMAEFARFIGGVLLVPVSDQTGLTGRYDIEMTLPRAVGPEEQVERVTGILLNELGLQLVTFNGPFTVEEQNFDKKDIRFPVARLPDGTIRSVDSQAATSAKAGWVQLPDGSYKNVSNVSNSGGYALKLDHSDAPGLKPSTEQADSLAQALPAGVYDIDTPGIPTAVANRLRLIDGAKQQWALEKRKQPTDTPTWEDIQPYLRPAANGDFSDYTNSPDGRYIIGSVASKPQIRANALVADNPVVAKQNACINILRLIDSSKQQWALEFRKQSTDTPTADDLRPFLGRGGPTGELPVCPDGGVYTYGSVGEKPSCSVQGHALP